MKTYVIYREAGPQAKRKAGRYGYARPRRTREVQASGVVDALAEFVFQQYLTTFHPQYAGSQIEYERRGKWVPWKPLEEGGEDLTERMDSGRNWRVRVTLRNGRSEHDATYVAWKEWRA